MLQHTQLFCCVLTALIAGASGADPLPRPYATKTIYRWSFSPEERQATTYDEFQVPSGCRPIQVNAFFRHGSRNPDDDTIKDAENMMERIGGHIQSPEYSALNNWTSPFAMKDEGKLVAEGRAENDEFGQNFGKWANSLLKNATSGQIQLIASEKSRTKDSAKAFTAGLQKALGHTVDEDIHVQNKLTRYYDHCKKYIDEVDDHPIKDLEVDKFMKGPEVKELINKFNERLKLDGNRFLTTTDLEVIYEMTALETAYFNKSLWRDLWKSEDEFEVMQYADDIESYWERGNAFPITYEQSCVVLKKMFDTMDEAKQANKDSNRNYIKGLFMFGHSNSVVPLITLLNLFLPERPLKADNYEENKNRTLRYNEVGPFAVNVGFVEFVCTEGAHGQAAPTGIEWPATLEKYMVQMLFKETPTKIPNVCDKHLCSYNDVRQKLSKYIDKCNFEERCKNGAMSSPQAVPFVSFLIFMLVFVVL